VISANTAFAASRAVRRGHEEGPGHDEDDACEELADRLYREGEAVRDAARQDVSAELDMPDQREYRMAVLRPETPEGKGLYSLNWSDGGKPAPGVVRTGLADALFWIQTMEQNRAVGLPGHIRNSATQDAKPGPDGIPRITIALKTEIGGEWITPENIADAARALASTLSVRLGDVIAEIEGRKM
jgi:hypothetical protein